MAEGRGFGPEGYGMGNQRKNNFDLGEKQFSLVIDKFNLASCVVQNRRRNVQGYVKMGRKLFTGVAEEQWDVMLGGHILLTIF